MAVFDWWLLIVGLVIGAGLVWLVLADSSRRENEILDDETAQEAAWISATLADEGRVVDPGTTEKVLRLHRTYLESLPPDEPVVAVIDPRADDVEGRTADEEPGAPGPASRRDPPPQPRHDVSGDPLPARDR
jgi:hypothetical protein